MNPVGLIGIGRLGSAIGVRLLAAGFEVLGWDPDDSCRAWLESSGGRAATAFEIAMTCRRIVVCVPNSDPVWDLAKYVRPGTIVIDAGNPEPEDAVKASELMRARAAAYIDAPVCDWHETVREQGGRVLAGGDGSALAGASEVLASFARELVHAGPPGAGVRLKRTQQAAADSAR